MEGNSIPVMGGVIFDMTAMDRIIAVNVGDRDCHVEAGADRLSLEAHLRDSGLFFPVDPGAKTTIGGMVATRAAGTTTVMYGSMRDNVLGLEVVLADGRVIRTGGRTARFGHGYDLTSLFVGSEGTLGLISKVRLKLHPVPERILAAVLGIPKLTDATALCAAIMKSGLSLARCEIADEVQMAASIRFSGLELDALPTLFLEFHGSETDIAKAKNAVEAMTTQFGVTHLAWAVRAEDRRRLWRARHDAGPAGRTLRTWDELLITDVAVPISALAECLIETKKDLERSGLVGPIVGHAGDGNFHVTVLLRSDEVDAGNRFHDRLVARAIALGGTCTGEHGVGIGKRKYLLAEYGPALGIMRALKSALDPLGLLNPGKVV